MTNEVTAFYQRQSELLEHLLAAKELSLAQDAEQMLQKNLPLAAASYFEHVVTAAMRSYVRVKSNDCEELTCLFDQKVIKRQYHTLFDWDKSHVNKFWGLFGEAFKTAATAEIAADAELAQSIKDFLIIGELRNNIVHQNYVAYASGKSAAEIFQLFISAERFVEFARARLS
jgi:hypothetical protein